MQTILRGGIWAVALNGNVKFAEPVTVVADLSDGKWRCRCLNLDREVVVLNQHFLYKLPEFDDDAPGNATAEAKSFP